MKFSVYNHTNYKSYYGLVIFLFLLLAFINEAIGQDKPKIVVFSGPTATIQNSYPLITSNKARKKHGLPLLENKSGNPKPYDRLYYQRLAKPVTVYIEMFTAHPLESDVKELYQEPDGYLDSEGNFHEERQSPDDKPVLEATLRPGDGLYPLPYMALQDNGDPWNATYAYEGAPFSESRQTFYPDASRILQEIERKGGNIYGLADYEFVRPAPAGGYTKGLDASERTDEGFGDIPPETLGKDFFTYGPYGTSQNRKVLARATNIVQESMASGEYLGSIWLEGSPSIENTSYWMSLLIDTEQPMVFNAAQRKRGLVSADGDRNIMDGIDYIKSKVWANEAGIDKVGGVMIQAQVIYSTREVQKADAKPDGYVTTGGYGGVVGTMGYGAKLTFLPVRKHTHQSEVRTTVLPDEVNGVQHMENGIETVSVEVKDAEGKLVPEAIPFVTIFKSARWRSDDDSSDDPSTEVDILARLDDYLENYPLAGFVGEGMAPYGSMTDPMEAALEKAALSGIPVVKAARGNAGGFMDTDPDNLFIEGQNTTSTKARILLMAGILKLGALPPAADPEKPTDSELEAIKSKISDYQEIFNTH